MRPASGCKLFGAYQALGGIQDGVVLLHSVVGCNFGSMSLHVAQDMRDIRQTCTVISDSDVVFSGEASLERAVRSALELFQPSVLFVVSGCVSEMIGDDIPAVLARIPHEAPLLHVEAAGFRGDAARGLEAGWLALLPLMKPPVPRPYPRPYPRSDPRPLVNLIGLGMDDPHAADDVEARAAVRAAYAMEGPVYLRFGRLAVPVFHDAENYHFEIGKGEQITEGSDIAIIATGLMVNEARIAAEQLAAEGIHARVINIHTIKPLDEEIVLKAAKECGKVITAEEHNVIGGLGEAVCAVLSEKLPTPVRRVGVQDVFGCSGPAWDLLKFYGLDAATICKTAHEMLGK